MKDLYTKRPSAVGPFQYLKTPHGADEKATPNPPTAQGESNSQMPTKNK